MVFAAYLYFLVKSLLYGIRDGNRLWMALGVILIGVLAGAGTHLLIKYRPYMSVPSLSYKCMPSVLASTILLGFALMRLREIMPDVRRFRIAFTIVCLIILWGAFTRPPRLSYLNSEVGLGGYPNPAKQVRNFVMGL
jgi:hypothetical protein